MQPAPHSRLRAFGSLSARLVSVTRSCGYLRFGGCEARLLRQFVPVKSGLHHPGWARCGEFAQIARSGKAQKPSFLDGWQGSETGFLHLTRSQALPGNADPEALPRHFT